MHDARPGLFGRTLPEDRAAHRLAESCRRLASCVQPAGGNMSDRGGVDSLLQFAKGKSEQIDKVLDEVDRFLRGVRLELEDWKFEMEDLGDGTRIFVRFQLNINPPGSPRHARTTARAEVAGEPTRAPGEGTSLRGGGESGRDRERVPAPDTKRGRPIDDPDIPYFIESWREAGRTTIEGEYHEPGSPFMDAPSPPARTRRPRSRATRSSPAGGRTTPADRPRSNT